MELKGSKTEKNLQAAFAGESMANTKYTFYSMKAREEGYEQIADFFKETARNEQEHAFLWFKFLHDGLPTTPANLKDAAAGENYEWTTMYVDFAKDAEEEGFNKIAFLMKEVGRIEARHEARYNDLVKNIEDNKVFKKDEKVVWECDVCGYQVEANNAPSVCPVCGHNHSHFAIDEKNY